MSGEFSIHLGETFFHIRVEEVGSLGLAAVHALTEKVVGDKAITTRAN